MKMQLFTKVNHGNTILLKDRNFLKTFTRKRVNICFDFQGLEQENEEKLQLQPSQINISLLIVMEREGEGEGKKKPNIPAAHFLSLTLSITAGRQLGRERVSQTIRPAL